MRQVLLDTSFILTAIKQRIDFFEELEHRGFEIIIPEQVIREIHGLKSLLALKIIKMNKFRQIDIKQKEVDSGIIYYARSHPKTIIATLDDEIKRKIKNPKLVIRQKKKLEII